jgi:hypothetical protein
MMNSLRASNLSMYYYDSKRRDDSGLLVSAFSNGVHGIFELDFALPLNYFSILISMLLTIDKFVCCLYV